MRYFHNQVDSPPIALFRLQLELASEHPLNNESYWKLQLSLCGA